MQQSSGALALFSSSWSTFKAHWKPFVAITILPSLALYIGQLLSSAHGLAYGLLGAILMLAGAVTSIALQPALITAVHKIHTQSSAVISFKEQYKAGFRYFWVILGLAIFHGVIIAGSTLFFVVPMIIVEVYTCLYIFIRILDDKKGTASFLENYSLVKGRWWGTLGRLLFLGAIYVIFSMAVVGIVFIIGKVAGFSLNSSGAEPFSGILNLLLNALMMPLGVLYLYNLYVSLKATRRADVPTAGFKKWLIFFVVVGILALVLLPILGFGLATLMSVPHP